MLRQPFRIVTPFPGPPALVRHALNQLDAVRAGDADTIAELHDIADLPRPWEPARCPAQQRHHIWLWCDDVVAWINREYAWRTAQLIPTCWPRHPHLANELPLLACLRVQASNALSPEPLEDWHRYTLPLFVERFTARLGDSSCRAGTHADWPAAPRHTISHDEPAVTARQSLFELDATS